MKKIVALAAVLILCSSLLWADIKGDINGDDKVGLEEAVYALQATAGLSVQPVEDTCITCEGKLTPKGRWCNQGDGTVKDMTTGLVWLEKADWGGTKPWRNPASDCSSPDYTCYDDAHSRAGLLSAADATAGLSDGSGGDDWRLPTMAELYGLANGTEAVRSDSM